MPSPSFQKGIESLIAEMLRAHVVDAVFDREEVRRGLPPERLEALKKEILERLTRAEADGREDRPAVTELLDRMVGLTGPAGAAAMAVLRSLCERIGEKKGGG